MSSFNTSRGGYRRTPYRPGLSKFRVTDRSASPERRAGGIGRVVSAILAAWLMVAVSACGRSEHERLAIPSADTDAPRIVILPFQNLGQPEDAFLASGLSQEISSRLVALRGLRVVTPRSGTEAGHGLPDVIGIGHALDVDYVLDAKVLWDKGASSDRQLVVEPRLFDTSDAKL